MSRYAESLRYLYGLQRFGVKLGLENTRLLLERLGHPQQAFPVVHVAGTNGKGSVCATLHSLFCASGLRSGLYTSPHLLHFGERIRVAEETLSEERMVTLTDRIRSRSHGISPTFFEFTTVMALEHFRNSSVDVCVLETGMGGRLDATNAVSPVLCVITPVSRDHASHLGQSLGQIAAEKGGIIKPGVPLVLSRQEPEALAVLEETASRAFAPVLLEGRDFHWRSSPEGLHFEIGSFRIGPLALSLPGEHQKQNAALALAAWHLLRAQGMNLREDCVGQGLASVRWPGRLQWWDGRILLDGAHNEAGARVLADYLESLGRPVHWIAGFKGDKDVAAILELLLPRVGRIYGVPVLVEEPCPVDAIGRLVMGRAAFEPCAGFSEALRRARARCAQGELILVAGSLFLIAEALQILGQREG